MSNQPSPAAITNADVPEDNFPEARGIVFTQMYGVVDKQVVQFNVTSRGETLAEAIDDLMIGMRYAKETYKLSLSRPDMRPEPKPAPERAPATTPAQVPQPTADGNHRINAVKLEIVPEADDKVTLKWYGAGHQFPDIASKRITAKALELLKSTGEQWEDKDLWRAATRPVTHTIIYEDSDKLNSQGKPYKNIVRIVSGGM